LTKSSWLRRANCIFANVPFLRATFERVQQCEPAPTGNGANLSREREKLEAERQKLLRMTMKGTITESDYERQRRAE
jgi:hypothetical protein